MHFSLFLVSLFACCHLISPLFLNNFLNLPMHTARIPPVDPAPATITAVLAMHTGHICLSSDYSSISLQPAKIVGQVGNLPRACQARVPILPGVTLGCGYAAM